MKADHRIEGDKHVVLIDGLRVWLHQEGRQWIANGIDIDYATAGETKELAAKAFLFGLCLTIVEHVKRFRSLERLIARRAPDEIYQAWIRELESSNLEVRPATLTLPEEEMGDLPHLLPGFIKFFEPTHVR